MHVIPALQVVLGPQSMSSFMSLKFAEKSPPKPTEANSTKSVVIPYYSHS